MSNNIKELLNTVVANDYCIGCGVCASLNNSSLSMKLNDDGKYQPVLSETLNEKMEVDVLSVCPFSNENKNEDEIGEETFGEFENIKTNEYTGYYLKNYAGYVVKEDYRERGSSGGMGNWIAGKLLETNMVDGIIHIRSAENGMGVLFDYNISYTKEELFEGAKSKYYPIELSKVIKLIKEKKGTYAVIGVPCYIKSLRLLSNNDDDVKNRLKYFIGLVCGHLKSDMFAKSIGWQMGISPNKLEGIDFRKKLEGKYANDYGVEVRGKKEGEQIIKTSRTKELFTTNWGHGLFKYNACEFCDDVLAETADVTVGDAWLPKYSKDELGTNIVTVRNPSILNLFNIYSEELYLEEISTEDIFMSQAGGFRHRRDGLAYRLFLKDQDKQWRPVKRVKSKNDLSNKRKKTFVKRMELSKESFKAFKEAERKDDFNVFIELMSPKIVSYNKLVGPSKIKKIIRRLKKEMKLN